MKLVFSLAILLSAAAALHGRTSARGPETKTRPRPLSVVEATIPQMQAAMREGRVTSRELVTQYLVRIAVHEDQLHAIMTVNPRALQEASELDRERASGRVRGPLHGIPVAGKDNALTRDIVT